APAAARPVERPRDGLRHDAPGPGRPGRARGPSAAVPRRGRPGRHRGLLLPGGRPDPGGEDGDRPLPDPPWAGPVALLAGAPTPPAPDQRGLRVAAPALTRPRMTGGTLPAAESDPMTDPTQGLPVDRTEPVPWTASTATPSPAPRR